MDFGEELQCLFRFPMGETVISIASLEGMLLITTTRAIYEVVGDKSTRILIRRQLSHENWTPCQCPKCGTLHKDLGFGKKAATYHDD